jgi:hypothetical protein
MLAYVEWTVYIIIKNWLVNSFKAASLTWCEKLRDDGRQLMAKAHIAFVIQHMPTFKQMDITVWEKMLA